MMAKWKVVAHIQFEVDGPYALDETIAVNVANDAMKSLMTPSDLGEACASISDEITSIKLVNWEYFGESGWIS